MTENEKNGAGSATAGDERKMILEELHLEITDSLTDCGLLVTDLSPAYRVLYANRLFVRLLGYKSQEELVQFTDGQAIRLVAPEALEQIRTAEKEKIGQGTDELSYCLCGKNGERHAVLQRFCRRTLKNGRDVLVSAFFDGEIPDQQTRAALEKKLLLTEDKALRAEQKFRIAIANSRLAVWECDFAGKRNLYPEETVKRFHIPAVVENVPEGLIATGNVHPDSEKTLLAMYRAVMGGAPHAEGVIATRRPEGDQWLKMSLITMYSADGVPESAVCTAEDITREKVLLQRMEDELERRAAYEANQCSMGSFDLTADRLLEYRSSFLPDGAAVGLETYCEAVGTVAEQIPNEGEKESFLAAFLPENLRKMYDNGTTETHLAYRRRSPDGGLAWLDTHMHLVRQPSTGHLMAFLHTSDISEQMQAQDVLHTIANDNYDGIVLINMRDGSYRSFTQVARTILPLPMAGKNYWGDVLSALKACVSDEEYAEARSTRNMDFVRQTLQHENECAFVVNLVSADGRRKTMKMQYVYLDDSRQYLLATGMDITAAMREEKMQKDALESALLAAKQASSAKTSFLSRMSHEIRTPLNAILGMAALAAQANGNEEEVRDCISKIGISGHYLLSLINDILDMSRIESGKMLLRNEPFSFSDLIESINTVIYGQTVQKGINYETVVSHGLDDGYIGDIMKLQQILVNILGNAVKFTAAGGKITFSVSLVSRDNVRARLRFAVNDTGCGIEQNALERIFEPFEQQDGSTTAVYGGTGLGLAISKNLAELMGGTINVRSIVNVGSEFIVEVPLTIDPALVKKRPEEYSFADLRTLIVDDDILVCEQTSRTLKDIGMIPEWVTSGEQAIQRVSELWNKKQNFDFILVDWKMPDMDGIETSRRIRRIVGPDVTIIIMTAYDWASIEAEAKAAGVNMCISKPMLKSTLVSAFTRATGEVEHEKLTGTEPEFDFTGRRILLAEDHPLNAEIATRLLSKRGCTVEVAENGLKAMERFTTSPVHYYDAILMDIRMPIMDGLQAATNIRHWDKEDAKTIPIIAMTANAFDEDVDKSKAAGMDAHLAKPIDPVLLYRVLYRLMK